MQGRAVLPCHSLFDCLFLLEPVSCRGQRIARSNGKRNWSFTKNITTFAAVVEVHILIAMFFLFFFLKYCISKHLCAPQGARIHRPKCIWPTENCQKNGYRVMKNCNASTHQPAHRKICLTLIISVHRTCTSVLFFLSTFTSKHIFIDFVVLLHWTTQQNKSAPLRLRLRWQFLKKKKKRGKVCQARVVSCCPAILLLSFFFFFFI